MKQALFRLPGAVLAGSRVPLVLALSYYLALSRWQIWPLVFVVLVWHLSVVATAADGRTAMRRLFPGWWASFAASVIWIEYVVREYGRVPIPLSLGPVLLLTAYAALYPVLAGGLAHRLADIWIAWMQRRRTYAYSLPQAKGRVAVGISIPLFVAFEVIRERALTGFGWSSPGYAFAGNNWLLQAADIGGVSLLTLLALLVAWGVQRISRKGIAFAVLVLALWAGYGAWQVSAWQDLAGQAHTIRVGVVQGNVDQWAKWNRKFRDRTIDGYLALSEALLAEQEPVDLLVWPETAMPFYVQQPSKWRKRLSTFAIDNDLAFVTGVPAYARGPGGRESRNRAVLFGREGKILDHVDKQHLVPFGEYVPLKPWLSFIEKMVEGTGDFTPGDSDRFLDWQHEGRLVRLGMAICYEILFSFESRDVMRASDLMLVITNDAWFGPTDAPYQQVAMAQVRAVENRRAIVRAANTGVSGWIAPTGQLHQATDIFVPARFRDTIPLLQTDSFFAVYGAWWEISFMVLAGSAILLILAQSIRRRIWRAFSRS